MDSKTKWLIAGFVYMLGVMGTFFVTVGKVRQTTYSDVDAVGEAALRAAVWPVELIKMVL
ncbi:MAG: hypothetical protein QF893_08520 [Alphaproteobacteria bacterium]|jgi:hypothetical protein|nr:hypothetical protein [Alphaproteobacteria bacterium]